jgi:hypothetical protein
MMVSRAVALGMIDEAALGKPLLEKLSSTIKSFREMQDE